MPFNGLTSFLQPMILQNAVKKVRYQCPLTGLLHFYMMNEMMTMEKAMYQCPLTGLLHFYPYPLEAIIYAASRGLNSPKLSDNLKIAYFLTYFWFF